MVTKHLYDFATPDGGGYPNDPINDNQAFVDAAAFFQDRGGYGTLILENGLYLMGRQNLWTPGEAVPDASWDHSGYPGYLGGPVVQCPSLVANQQNFKLTDCVQFTVEGGTNTTVRYRDCLYYGTFLRDSISGAISSAVGIEDCRTCEDSLHMLTQPDLLHAAVGVMFNFWHCDSITVRNLELDGNIDNAILGGRSRSDGMQTEYDGVDLLESSRCTVDNVSAHHFGRDGMTIFALYTSTTTLFADVYDHLVLGIDSADIGITTPGNYTVLFNNTVLNSSFNWNCRTGFAWGGCAGLTMTNCEMNYNAAGRFGSSTASGIDIEGIGGPMRVRHGLFTNCDFLHNAGWGILADNNGLCNGQVDFKFFDCVVKAGEDAAAMMPNNKGMKFFDCEIYGRVANLFEQAEDQLNDTSLNLLFRRTNFHEEDEQWAYLPWDSTYLDSTVFGGPNKLDLVAPYGQAACITFDSCGFFTNCYGTLRLLGRAITDLDFPYCTVTCDSCGVPGNTCPPGSCGTGPYLGGGTAVDARHVRAINCRFKNTGRIRWDSNTILIAVDRTTVVNFDLDVPDAVRGQILPIDRYITPFGLTTWAIPSCLNNGFCSDVDTTYTTYDEWPLCKPFFALPDTIDRWDFCDPGTGNMPVAHCASDANCYAPITIPDSAYASSVGTVFTNDSVSIQGVFFVDDDVLFQGSAVFMQPGAQIVVLGGHMLDIETSSFVACIGTMWKSITVHDSAMVRIRGSFMDDAESLIEALDGSTVWVDNVQFHNNRVGIGIPQNGQLYNDVACYVANSTFYTAGPMPAPYPGQSSVVGAKGFAAVDAHNTTLDFTGGNNIIHTMSNGVVAYDSDVTVVDCRMQNIAPDAAYDYVGNGAGIYANGENGYYTVKQQGYGMTGPPSFNGCRWGVYTEYMSVRSSDNNMLDMGTAYRVDRSGFRDVDIVYNKVFTHRNGIDLRFNDGAEHIRVEGNDITFGDADCPLCRSYSAIFVSEGNMDNDNSVITGNSIRFLAAPNSRFGISLVSANDWLVVENHLLMADNAFNFTGIHLNGCNRPEVSCNWITGASLNYPVDGQAAIRNMMGSDVLISCNQMDSTTNGMLFNFVAPNTEVRGNFFHNHKWSLHLDGTAVIGAQELKGNLWYNAASAGGVCALYEDTLNAFANPFLVNPTTISGGTTMPPSVSPNGWFQVIGGVNYDCADHHGEQYCLLFGGERCQGCLGGLDERIASDSLENDPYTVETKWILADDLYKRLDDTPALLDSLPILETFYAELQGSATAAFKAIGDDQLVLYELDSAVVEQLHAKRTQIEDLLELVRTGLEQLGDSALTPVQREEILSGISDYRETIRDLSTWNSSALQVASSSKALSANDVQTTNSGVGTIEVIEQNQKTVNDIYLATIGKDVDTFTLGQADALLTVAEQCPMVGGNAVFKARSLYWLIDDAREFDDALLCLPHGIIVKRSTEQLIGTVSVIPNPASDEATLVLDQTLDEPGVFVVFDALGTEVLRHAVPTERSRFAFSTASLAPALYHYQVRGPSGIIGDGKITIVR